MERRALLVERQRIMIPFLIDVLQRAGVRDVVTSRTASARSIGRARPDVVVIDCGTGTRRPLELIRRLRRDAPASRIVVLVHRDDPLWNDVARALGADAVLGSLADRVALAAAIAA